MEVKFNADVTRDGAELLPFEPFPSFPKTPAPQQKAEPTELIPQAKPSPEEMYEKVMDGPARRGTKLHGRTRPDGPSSKHTESL
jgi:hypothetical protein